MSLYVDLHAPADLGAGGLGRLLAAIDEGEPGEAQPLDLYVAERGWVYCLIAAPHAHAVRAHHAQLGLRGSTVRPLVLPPSVSYRSPEGAAQLRGVFLVLWWQEGPSCAGASA